MLHLQNATSISVPDSLKPRLSNDSLLVLIPRVLAELYQSRRSHEHFLSRARTPLAHNALLCSLSTFLVTRFTPDPECEFSTAPFVTLYMFRFVLDTFV